MEKTKLPLKEVSIRELFAGNEKYVYEIPIYQRNYAWEKDEIAALIQDVYDSYKKDKEKHQQKVYYIGTLVTFHKGDNVFEIIDGQQRLTTIRLILDAFGVQYSNRLTYRARKKADDTLKSIKNIASLEEKDRGIENGFNCVRSELDNLIDKSEKNSFQSYFLDQVHVIHYRVPKDIDLNHYFEVMNSRGEQLEKHEIVKAHLMRVLDNTQERNGFNMIWECCSKMSMYVQQTFDVKIADKIFGNTFCDFVSKETGFLEELYSLVNNNEMVDNTRQQHISITGILKNSKQDEKYVQEFDVEKPDSFQPIIDFPNFLLIVLKIIRMDENGFSPESFTLDDKELLNEFDKSDMNSDKVRKFAYTLLKAKFLLDNYIVHHAIEEDTMENNPWKLQIWHKENNKGILKNLSDGTTREEVSLQNRLVNLLSMFEVSFTARQRKNYLFYCLLYLLNETLKPATYADFLEKLADNYFAKIYMDSNMLNEINTPKPGSFDETILKGNKININDGLNMSATAFNNIYGDGTVVSKGVPLFVFNYLDYKLWKLYDKEIRGEKLKKEDQKRKEFFEKLGCSDFGLDSFDLFYFSRTRRSLEHFFPQANVTGENDTPTKEQINCFGNYAMIGSEANSSGSNWAPKSKVVHYRDKKIKQISVASLKFFIMMQICSDRGWSFEEIQAHQEKMVALLVD